MTTYARLVVVGTMLASGCAWAAEPSPVAFAKSVVSERGSQTFATVSYPDKNLIVQFRLEPYTAGKSTVVRAFGEITKKSPKARSADSRRSGASSSLATSQCATSMETILLTAPS